MTQFSYAPIYNTERFEVLFRPPEPPPCSGDGAGFWDDLIHANLLSFYRPEQESE